MDTLLASRLRLTPTQTLPGALPTPAAFGRGQGQAPPPVPGACTLAHATRFPLPCYHTTPPTPPIPLPLRAFAIPSGLMAEHALGLQQGPVFYSWTGGDLSAYWATDTYWTCAELTGFRSIGSVLQLTNPSAPPPPCRCQTHLQHRRRDSTPPPSPPPGQNTRAGATRSPISPHRWDAAGADCHLPRACSLPTDTIPHHTPGHSLHQPSPAATHCALLRHRLTLCTTPTPKWDCRPTLQHARYPCHCYYTAPQRAHHRAVAHMAGARRATAWAAFTDISSDSPLAPFFCPLPHRAIPHQPACWTFYQDGTACRAFHTLFPHGHTPPSTQEGEALHPTLPWPHCTPTYITLNTLCTAHTLCLALPHF